MCFQLFHVIRCLLLFAVPQIFDVGDTSLLWRGLRVLWILAIIDRIDHVRCGPHLFKEVPRITASVISTSEIKYMTHHAPLTILTAYSVQNPVFLFGILKVVYELLDFKTLHIFQSPRLTPVLDPYQVTGQFRTS